ncbi:hypothetical protein GCM10028827_00850 [Mucilaginibacter myungsuensis]
MDAAPFQGRPTDEPLLESVNSISLCLYGDIGLVEGVCDVGESPEDGKSESPEVEEDVQMCEYADVQMIK